MEKLKENLENQNNEGLNAIICEISENAAFHGALNL